MKLRFLGKNTGQHQSPTLYATDHDSYVLQGWRTDRDDTVEIPHQLLGYLEWGTFLDAPHQDTGRGTFYLTGRPITDTETLSQMDIPDHEASVEIGRGKEVRPDATA
ncbi:hypothetical protein [Nocardia testacea]|uniref:hypothetical protein n=1 Tax=Nocardia testacea TaxID=248551 RepID=UPI0002EB73C6|nr:hypothetical protein [Nocardia testacea]